MWEDPAVTRPRRPWAVGFSVGAVFAGCVVTAVAFMAVTFAMLMLAPEEVRPDDDVTAVARLAVLIGGLAAFAILVIGPTIAYAVGWLLRDVRNQSLHVIAFALAGALVGGVIGATAGGLEVALLLAGMLGFSAAVGRMAVSPFARV